MHTSYIVERIQTAKTINLMWAISGIDGHPSNLVRAEGTERDVYMRVTDDEV